MRTKVFGSLLALGYLGLTCFSAQVLAQTTGGSIFGTIRDEQGLVIPNAKVVVRNEAIALVRETESNVSGDYSFPALPVGKYVIAAEASGFSRVESTPLELQLNQYARVDIVLRVGAREEVVYVSAQPPLVDLSTSAIGEVVNEREVVDLPLNGRNFLQLATLQAGITPAKIEYAPSGGTKLLNQLAAETSQVNGLRIQSNNYLLDGADNNEQFYGFIAAVPNPDAVQEFRILTNSYSAQFGRGGGGVINVLTKSGTNEFHGTLFEFFRNDKLEASNFFLDEAAPLRQNQFGATGGGPIIKDKLFVFASYEGLRRREGSTVNVLAPTVLERSGDFSASANPPVDPLTGLPFPGNVIPPERINSINQGLLQFIPLPNVGQSQFVASPSTPTDGDQFLIKVDHHIGKSDLLTVNYFYSDTTLRDPTPGNFFGVMAYPGFDTLDSVTVHRVVLSEVHTFGNAVNTFRAAFNRPWLNSGFRVFKRDRSDFGFTFPSLRDNDLPIISIAGLPPFGIGSALDFFREDSIFQFSDDVALVRGRHKLSFGADVRRTKLPSDLIGFETGSYSYVGLFSGNAFADYLLGQPLFFLQLSGDTERTFFSKQLFFYVQDDIQVTPNLTVNVGLRYDYFSPLTEGRDLIPAFRPGQTSQVNPAYPEGLLVYGDPGITRSSIRKDLNNFAPRIGFAWDPFGKGTFSIRGAYGIFYDNIVGFIPFQLGLYPGLTNIPFLFAPADIADPFLGTSPFEPEALGEFPNLVPFDGQNQYNPLDPDFTTPYAQQWNLTFQYEPWQDLLLQAAYVGTKGTHLPGTHELNPADFVPGNTTPGNVGARRRFPEFGNLFNNETNFRSTYHSLQLTVKQRTRHGFNFIAAYTWSKAIDDTSVTHPFNSARGQQSLAQNTDDLASEKGLAAFDVRHRFVFSGVWDIPLWRRNDWKGRTLGNWTLTGIVGVQSGSPFTVLDSANPSLNGAGNVSDRPDLLCDPSGGARSVEQWFNTACFQTLPFGSGRFGTAGRNIVTGPGFANIDVGIFKNIPIDDVRRLEFRTEIFNLFNHPNFAIPINDIRSPAFGSILSTLPGNERKIQFGLKFYF